MKNIEFVSVFAEAIDAQGKVLTSTASVLVETEVLPFTDERHGSPKDESFGDESFGLENQLPLGPVGRYARP